MFKIKTLTLSLVLATAALTGQCLAEQQLIVRLKPNASAYAVALRHQIILRDRTENAPFALYGIRSYQNVDTVQAKLQADSRVVWAEDNVSVSTPEGQSAIKGSTIPAVGDRFKLYERNANVLTQINWSSTLANSFGRTVKIAVLDTGLALSQSYLWAKVDASANFIDGERQANIDSNGNTVSTKRLATERWSLGS
jgi:hypothetical protein